MFHVEFLKGLLTDWCNRPYVLRHEIFVMLWQLYNSNATNTLNVAKRCMRCPFGVHQSCNTTQVRRQATPSSGNTDVFGAGPTPDLPENVLVLPFHPRPANAPVLKALLCFRRTTFYWRLTSWRRRRWRCRTRPGTETEHLAACILGSLGRTLFLKIVWTTITSRHVR